MKIYVGMIAYNEELMIGPAIRSVYDYVDEIIVINGSPWGLSTDKTATVAHLIGPKVKVISGTYRSAKGLDHKMVQRQAYLDEMDKSLDNWCILHDADEVFTDENIRRLINHIRSASPETMLFGYWPINFIGDCWHICGGPPRKTSAWRLHPAMSHLNHHRVGIYKRSNWSEKDSPTRIMLNDVTFHHYGHALTFEKDEVRERCYLERGDFQKQGLKPHEWERCKKERLIPHYRTKEALVKTNKGLYEGEHPEAVKPLIGAFWPEKKKEVIKGVFIDVGELSYSLLINGHIRWLKQNTDHLVAVITYPDRKCLYEGLADVIHDVPEAFYDKFNIQEQSCFGLYGISPEVLKEFFQLHTPEGYSISEELTLKSGYTFRDRRILEPFEYSKELQGNKEILVFPRYRAFGPKYKFRNLPKAFYVLLIRKLCEEFPKLTIRTVGTFEGAYDIQVAMPNYVNSVGKGQSLQDLIDRCQLAVAAVGSQSAPPKITLLQGVPTFMIGHEMERHIQTDNWAQTKVGFYKISRNGYDAIDQEDCMKKIISFVKEEAKIVGWEEVKEAKIRLTEESVQTYWRARSKSDGIRTTGRAACTLAEQDEAYEVRKEFIFSSCPRHLRTLDYGCGIGRYAEDFKHYLGVDMTESLLDMARERCPSAKFLKLNSPFLDCKLDFEPELIFTATVLQHNPDDLVLKILESFVPIVKGNIMFGLYENTEAQSGHMRGRTAEEYVEMIERYFKIYEWESTSHRMVEAHAFTLIKAGSRL